MAGKQNKLDLNKKETSIIKQEFPELEDLMFRNKQAQRTAKKNYKNKR